MKLYLVFVCDKWHTHNSKDLISICDTLGAVENILYHYCNDAEIQGLNTEEIQELHSLKNEDKFSFQTQNRDQNFIVDKITKDDINKFLY